MIVEEQEMRRGEIYHADLNPVFGSEQGGYRPVLIIQNNRGNQHRTVSSLLTSENRIQICVINFSTLNYFSFHNHISFLYTP